MTINNMSPVQDDIESAARDSALLAEELAAMLDRLEAEGEGDEDQGTRDVVAAELVRALETTEELSKETRRREKKNKGKSIKKKLPRKPKSQDEDDFDFGFVGSLLDALDLEQEFDEEFGESGKRKEEEDRSSQDVGSKTASLEREPKESEPEESCEDSVAAVQVQVCVPDYTVQPQRLYFKAQETYDEKYCYTKYVFCTDLFYM